ncbi:hypothetical protein LMG28727_02935 [Paraburkholderia kirstenboschensis]|nr:hypothetical protein LMG28727_02935 [Paraburkholderia kirstenboschensis]
MGNALPHVDASTWRFMRDVSERLYHEKSLTDWLRDMRAAHSVLLGEDVRVDRLLSEAVAILEYTIITRGSRLPIEIASPLAPSKSRKGAERCAV